MEAYSLSKQDSFNPVLEVTIVLLTPNYLQVFDGKGCFGLFYMKVTNLTFKEKYTGGGSEVRKGRDP